MDTINRELSNPYISAYCQYRKLTVTPKMDSDGRVKFMISGDNIDCVINDFYGNPLIRLNDFLKHLRYVRGLIYVTKELNTSCVEQGVQDE